MLFAVEREVEGRWTLLDAEVEAGSPIQAVSRAAQGEGRYRARAADEAQAPPEVFRLPSWGPPEPATE
jgi:hypothetical protein